MSDSRFWAVVPAAGLGRRMGSEVPKQYLKVLDIPVIEITLRKLAAVPQVQGIVVALAEEDRWWDRLGLTFKKPVRTVIGGEERIHSVLNAVESIAESFTMQDWILVHDAARPCVILTDIGKLITEVASHPCGGLLAAPIHDTIKLERPEDRDVEETLDRRRLWRALTPQLFRAPLLLKGLRAGARLPHQVTDEASALERLGHHPRLVEGRGDNIKITRPEDLELAELYLAREARALKL